MVFVLGWNLVGSRDREYEIVLEYFREVFRGIVGGVVGFVEK